MDEIVKNLVTGMDKAIAEMEKKIKDFKAARSAIAGFTPENPKKFAGSIRKAILPCLSLTVPIHSRTIAEKTGLAPSQVANSLQNMRTQKKEVRFTAKGWLLREVK